MKKIILLLLVILFTFSCSSDDNSNTSDATDPIIGKWEELNSGSCQPSIFEFFTNNTVNFVGYIDNGGGCEVEVIDWEYFNWNRVSEGNYTLTSKVQGQSEETESFSATFSNNSMIWTYSGGNTRNFNKI